MAWYNPLDWVEEGYDWLTGSEDAEEAKGKDQAAEAEWRALRDRTPATPYIDPADLYMYERGEQVNAPTVGYGAPSERGGGSTPAPASQMVPGGARTVAGPGAGASATYNGPSYTQGEFVPSGGGMGPGASAWTGLESAYDSLGPSAFSDSEMGPSAFQGYESEFAGAGPSAFDPMAFDASALEGMGRGRDYFGGVMESGTDAVAEAEYARRQQQAEQLRRSNTEAALSDLEMRGQGGMGNRLLAEMSNSQAMIGDVYGAGLDANAIAQQRRDSAAGTYADVSEGMGRAQLDADALRARGMDDHEIARMMGIDSAEEARSAGLDLNSTTRAAGLDRFAVEGAAGRDTAAGEQAAGVDAFTNADWDRWMEGQQMEGDWGMEADTFNANRVHSTDDANIGMLNENTGWNAVGAPQQRFDNETTVTAGMTDQLAGSGQALRENAVYPLQDVILPTVSAAAKASTGK